MAEITQDIKDVNILSTAKSGRVKALLKMAWNGGEYKWNIRDYNTDEGKAFKGISLNEEELEELIVALINEGIGDYDRIQLALPKLKNQEEQTIQNFEAIFSEEKSNKYNIELIEDGDD